MADRNYFQTEKKGEIYELRKALHDSSRLKKRDALKKIIALMTSGKDVSVLFPDVVKCMQTTNIELKKLVYLYIINYARAQPELAILAINTFRKDSLDPNPLIRGLAIRTMGCIRLDQVTEYLMEPLRRCCKESDPYVRKTAAMCIAKLYDVSPQMVEEQGFISLLNDMIADANPMVVANSVAALAEISEVSDIHYLREFINSSEQSVSKLLSALNECTEWNQVSILDALALYEPVSARDAEGVMERVTARLSHANSAVVLSAAKIVMRLLNYIVDEDVIRAAQKKLSAPLVTLLSAEPEIQYVSLRNINLIIQKRPLIFATDIRVFFCKYNDPIYVKMEKIDIIVRLCTQRNIDQILMELKEYATEIDVEFVRTAVRGIGRCAIKIDTSAEKCITVLLDLIETRVNYVVQEAIIVIKDIFRKYPNRYESIISDLCENLDSLDEPEAKASMIWIIGEYADRIENADELLDAFMLNFHDESIIVQLQLLTAIVKLFLCKPSTTQQLVTRVLHICTDECNNPDLRDRAYIYWRLLSRDPIEARNVILCIKPIITSDSYLYDEKLLNILIDNISMLSSVFHKPPDAFSTRLKHQLNETESESEAENEKDLIERSKNEINSYFLNENDDNEESDEKSKEIDENEEDLIDSEMSSEESEIVEDLHSPNNSKLEYFKSISKPIVLAHTKEGKDGFTGLEIKSTLTRYNGKIYALFELNNKSTSSISNFKISFNVNSFGLDTSDSFEIPSLNPSDIYNTHISLLPNRKLSGKAPLEPLTLQTAIKCSLDIFYFSILYDISIIFIEASPLNKNVYKSSWQEHKLSVEPKKFLSFLAKSDEMHTQNSLIKILENHNIMYVASRSEIAFDALYFSALTTNNLYLMFEISLPKETSIIKIEICGPPIILRLAATSIIKIMKLFPNK